MDNRQSVEINFYQEDEVALFLETNVSEDEKFAELLLFCSFTLRTLSNLGDSETTGTLALFLSSHVRGNLDALIDQKGEIEIPSHILYSLKSFGIKLDDLKIVEYSGIPGAKRFIASLGFTDSHLSLQYSAKGFGFFARGVDRYAPNAVIALMKYLAKRRLGDEAFIQSLEDVASGCGDVVLGKQLRMTNQNKLAVTIASAGYNR